MEVNFFKLVIFSMLYWRYAFLLSHLSHGDVKKSQLQIYLGVFEAFQIISHNLKLKEVFNICYQSNDNYHQDDMLTDGSRQSAPSCDRCTVDVVSARSRFNPWLDPSNVNCSWSITAYNVCTETALFLIALIPMSDYFRVSRRMEPLYWGLKWCAVQVDSV